MKSTWSHHNPVRILAGRGCLDLLGQEITAGHWLLVTTAGATRRGLTQKILSLLPQVEISVCDGITPNPELDHLDQLTTNYRSTPIDGLIALGGGSVMDAAKVLSVTLSSELDKPLATSLREGKGQAWSKNLPVIAIPTTSGTGAEVTPFATVWDQSEHKKHSVTGDCVYPQLAVIDPELTLTLPLDETLYTGLDAISHALESLWNKNKTPVSEAWAWQALELANEALPVVLKESENLDAREKMQQASLLAGLAISQTRTAIAHSISYPLTSHYGVPHGLACSFTLASILVKSKERLAFSVGKLMLLSALEAVLENLYLKDHILKYLTYEQLAFLKSEMVTKGRADNFIFHDIDVDSILSKGGEHGG